VFFSLIYANIYKIIAVYDRFTVYYYEESIQEEKKMKKCLKCGAELDDGANFCRYCGSSQKVDSAEAIAQGYYAPNGMSQDYYDPNGTAQGYYAPNDMAQGYYAPNDMAQGCYDPNGTAQGYYAPNDMAQGYYDPNGTAQGYYDPNGMLQGYYDQNSMNPGVEQPVSKMPKTGKSREKKSKKSIMLIVGIAAAVVLAAVLFFLFFGREMISKSKIKSAAEDYAGYIEKLKVKELVKATAPKGLIEDIAVDAMRADGADFDDLKEFRDDFDDEYDDMIDDAYDEADDAGVKISLDDFKVEKVKKVDVKDVIQYVYDELGEKEIEGYDVDKVYALVKEKAEDYNLDLKKIYRVDISYDLSVRGDYFDWKDVKDALKDEGINVNDLCDHLYAYEYEGEYYLIPGVEDALIPSFKQYMEKVNRSRDISNADSIRTALQTALSDIDACESFYKSDVDNEYVILSETGMAKVPAAFRKEFDAVLGEYPEVKYIKDGYDKFAFKLDVESNTCTVYVTNGSDFVEISPDIDYDFYF
jgi:ribosomal protein L40E